MTSEEDKILSAVFRSEILTKVKRNLKEGSKEAKKRFLAKYPYANLSKFEFKVILKDNGDVDKYETYYPRANGAKRRSGRKPGARVTNFALGKFKVIAHGS